MEATGLLSRIADLLGSADRSSISALEKAEKTIGEWFELGDLPADIGAEIRQSYEQLCRDAGIEDLSVAVRSSATAEDSEGASFAGEYETFVGVTGFGDVERHIRLCWASAFTARSMTYAWKNGIAPTSVGMAVVVQKTVRARAAGVMFTLSPLTGDRSRIVIEASYGLGLSVVGGEVTPDRFVVSKVGGDILERIAGDKRIEYLNSGVPTPVDETRRGQLCLQDGEVKALARLGKTLERKHGRPVDIEFAIDRELPAEQNIVLLQCRPETYWTNRHAAITQEPIQDVAQAVLASVMRK
jgi:pyruvate,water dikinase